MSFTLRPYQEGAVKAGMEFFHSLSTKRPVIVAPTASGKSLCIASLANELQTGVLVLQPSKELLEQNYGKYTAYGGHASIFSASFGSKEIGNITFATIGSLKGRAGQFQHVKYVLIDECHLVPPEPGSMYVKFLAGLPRAKVLGLTATPFRSKTYREKFTLEPYTAINVLQRMRPRFFDSFVHITQIADLYEHGYLAPVRYIELTWDSGQLRVNTTGAEYSDASVDWALKQQRIYERLPGIVAQSLEKGRKHNLVFVKSVIEAAMLASKVPNAACVHAGTKPKERDRIITAFRAGEIKTVFNVGVLTTGFDFPALDTIIIARPTMSLALYMQMVGRGIRLHDGKQDCVLLDMCGNVSRFGELRGIEFATDDTGKWIIKQGERTLSGKLAK